MNQETSNIVRMAMAAGLISLKPSVVKPFVRKSPRKKYVPSKKQLKKYQKAKSEWERKRRAERYAQGLTALGTPRLNKQHPELKPFKPGSKNYNRVFMKLARAAGKWTYTKRAVKCPQCGFNHQQKEPNGTHSKEI